MVLYTLGEESREIDLPALSAALSFPTQGQADCTGVKVEAVPAISAALNVPTQGQADCAGVKVEGPFKGGHHRYCMTVQSSPSPLRLKPMIQVSRLKA